MGYNTLVAVKGSELAKIASDANFGAKLRTTMLMSQTRADKDTRHKTHRRFRNSFV
jgi:hypothetical protein